MKYREIQGNGLSVSEIGFGVWTLAHAQGSSLASEDPTHLMKYAVDRGINFFETADIYGLGRGEELIGNALVEERDRVVLSTRFGYGTQQPGWDEANAPTLTPEYLKKSCEKSLKRLRTDRIDIYQLHHPSIADVERDELYEMLEKLQKQGKIVHWGACLNSRQEWIEEAKLLLQLRHARCFQGEFHVFQPDPGEELLEALRSSDSRMLAKTGSKKEFFDRLEIVGDLDCLKEIPNRSMWQAFIKFPLWYRSVASVLVDITNEGQVNELASVSECPDLTTEEVKQVHAWQNEVRSLEQKQTAGSWDPFKQES